MMLMEQKELEAAKEAEYKRGFMDGVKLMEQRVIMAAESGKAIEIDGRAYFTRNDLQDFAERMERFGVEDDK